MIPELLFDIALCKNFCSLAEMARQNHPCNEIVDFQREKGAGVNIPFQIPEPWSGDISHAPVLVISSNPAYSGDELYPTSQWPVEMVADFFVNRFADRGPETSWVHRNKVLNKNGTRGKSVRYWSAIRNRVGELIGRQAVPGTDYCITELVHCKSSAEKGVAGALPECSRRYLEQTIGISGARVIMAIGRVARGHFNGNREWNGIPIVYLPHPNAFEPKTLAAHYTLQEIAALRAQLAAARPIPQPPVSPVELPSEEAVRAFLAREIHG